MSHPPHPHLEQFLGAYFHQDWTLDCPDSMAVVRRFIDESSPAAVRQLRQEIQLLLDGRRSDPEMLAELRRLGCCFEPASEGLGASKWLASVADALSTQRPARRKS